MTRKECLDAAAGCVLKDRNTSYGGPEDNFGRIAQMWNGYLGTSSIKPWDVAAMMGMLKMARARFNPKHADNWVDMAGYAACGIECATAQEDFDKALDEVQMKSMERMFKKAEGGKQEFKPGDKVQYRVELPSVSDRIWVDATYLRRAFDWQEKGRHIVTDEKLGPVTVEDDDIRPAPKAEGCEDLVFDEARMRESMPGIVPQDGPSDMDKPRHLLLHKPTGEELAEMAEEDGNA